MNVDGMTWKKDFGDIFKNNKIFPKALEATILLETNSWIFLDPSYVCSSQ